MKHRMYAVCYRDEKAKPVWVPFAGKIFHFREFARMHRNAFHPHGRVMAVLVEVVMPKRRKK